MLTNIQAHVSGIGNAFDCHPGVQGSNLGNDIFFFYFGPPFYSMLHLLIFNDRRPSFRWHIFFLSGLLHRYRIIRDRIFSFQIEVEHLEGITFLPADMGGGSSHVIKKGNIKFMSRSSTSTGGEEGEVGGRVEKG